MQYGLSKMNSTLSIQLDGIIDLPKWATNIWRLTTALQISVFFHLKTLFLIRWASSICKQLLHWFLKVFFTLRNSPWWVPSTCLCPVHRTVLGCESFESSPHSRLGRSHWASQAGLLHHSGLGKQTHPDPANQTKMYWYLYTHLVIL